MIMNEAILFINVYQTPTPVFFSVRTDLQRYSLRFLFKIFFSIILEVNHIFTKKILNLEKHSTLTGW